MYRPALSQPYTTAQLETIYTDALRVLDKLGIACEEKQTVERVTAQPGVRWEKGRLHFDPDTVRAHVDDVRRETAATPPAPAPPFEAIAPWCCLNYADPESGEVRSPTTADAIRMTRMMDGRNCANWAIPLVPRDVPPRHATLTAEFIALNHSRGLGGFMPAMDATEIEFLIEMHQVAGRTYLLDEQIGISPLRFNDHGLASALKFQGRKDINVILVGPIPAVGSTTPLPVRAALAQSAAEGLGLSVIVTRLGFGRGGFGCGLEPFDFQHAGIVFGGPEEMFLMAVSRQMSEFLNGRRSVWGNLHSMARMPDAQAAAERMASVLWQGMLGARRFRGAGQLAVDEVFSPLQAVIDDDIMKLTAKIVGGLEVMDDLDPVAEIAAGLESGNFMDAESTVRGFREFGFWPDLFHRYNVGRWRMNGSPTVLAEAWERAQQQIKASTWQLTDDQARDLDRLYRRALKEVPT